jgi:hypothetical protein
MERYCSVGFDDDHGFEYKLSDLGLTWRLTPPPTALKDAEATCGSVSAQGQKLAAAEARVNAESLNEKLRDALAHVACLCSAIETQSPSATNEFVENERKRARDFLKSTETP